MKYRLFFYSFSREYIYSELFKITNVFECIVEYLVMKFLKRFALGKDKDILLFLSMSWKLEISILV